MSSELPPEREPSPQERDKAQAHADLEAILILRKNGAFQNYFLRRLREKMEPLEHALLHDLNSAEPLREKQLKLATLRDMAELLATDETANRSIASR